MTRGLILAFRNTWNVKIGTWMKVHEIKIHVTLELNESTYACKTVCNDVGHKDPSPVKMAWTSSSSTRGVVGLADLSFCNSA